MLGIPTFKRGDETKLKVNFSGAMEGAGANIFIEPRNRANVTEVPMHFHNLKEAPKGQAYILEAFPPVNRFLSPLKIVNLNRRNNSPINSATASISLTFLL